MSSRVLAVWWLTCLLWSSVWLFIKIGVTAVPPLSLAGLRLAIALLILLPLFLRTPARVAPRDWKIIALSGFLLLGVNYALVFWGTQFVSSGVAAILQATTPALGMVLGRWLGHQPPAMSQLAGVGLGVAGVALVSVKQLDLAGSRGLLGATAVAAGALCVATAYTLVKTRLTHLPPVVILVGQSVVGCAFLMIAALPLEGNPIAFRWTTSGIVALLYLAIAGSVIGFWLNLWLLHRTSTAAILAMSIVQPLLALVLGAVFLGERLPPLTGVGAALILLSIWLVVVRAQPRSG